MSSRRELLTYEDVLHENPGWWKNGGIMVFSVTLVEGNCDATRTKMKGILNQPWL